jgi:hypothetical protein
MFCLIVKGDIDADTDTRAMRQDWEQVQALARDLGDDKWQYRAQGQLGIAAFYEGDLETARKNVAAAVFSATKAGVKGGAKVSHQGGGKGYHFFPSEPFSL